jgi:putative peptidoglycan lipid II flippase
VDEQAHAERERFFGGVKVTAGLTLVSRVFGMARAVAVASLGAGADTDAFAMAWRIPNLFRRLFGEGALSAAFVPVFTETAEGEGLESARGLLNNSFGLLAALLTGLLVLIEAGLLAWGLLGAPDPNQRLLLGLIAIMLPFMVGVCLLALGSAALNCRAHFAYPAGAPILLNALVIAAAWWVAPAFGGDLPGRLHVVGASVALAGVVQLVPLLPLLGRAGLSLRPRVRPLHPGIGRMLRRMAPMLVGLGFLQIAELLETIVAWMHRATETRTVISLFGRQFVPSLEAGVLVRVDAARYLYQLPLGVLAMSLGVAVFPLLSRYAARKDMPSLRGALNRALRLGVMEGLASGVGLFVLAGPITRLLYRRGNFTDADAALTAQVLQAYVVGMWAFCAYPILVRAFYAAGDTRTPLKTGCALVLPHLALVTVLVWTIGGRAFGAATATTFSLDVLVLLWILRRRLGGIGGRALAASVARGLAASGAMGAAVWWLREALAHRGSAVVVGVCVPAGAVVFLAVAAALRAPELKELLVRRRRDA